MLWIPVVLCSCAKPASHENPWAAMRYERAVDGRWQYVITLPRHGVYLKALHCMVQPLAIGSNVASPHVFVHRGTIDDAAEGPGWKRNAQPLSGERIQLSAGLGRELVELADRTEAGPGQPQRLADRYFEAGLLPHLLEIDLGSFGSAEQSARSR
ncbi:MAG TPA: hypothetical protein VFZ65_13775 [Planctomycetota bacterium]|nr:hypothetical protein [Planctomycetota bacterium]